MFFVIINLMGNCGFTRREASSSRSTCCIHNEGELGLLEEKEVRASNHCHESEDCDQHTRVETDAELQ